MRKKLFCFLTKKGGRPAGRISGTYGIVEYMNGVVGVVRPEQIIFMDTKDFIPKKYR